MGFWELELGDTTIVFASVICGGWLRLISCSGLKEKCQLTALLRLDGQLSRKYVKDPPTLKLA